MRQLTPTETCHPLLKITSAAQLELRARILAAAKRCFARFGREDTSLADVARLAHLEVEDVQEHFEDTEELLVVVQRCLDQVRAARRPTDRPGRQGFAPNARKPIQEILSVEA